MTAKVIMFQGTGSDVGKSVLTAALCRIARRRGLSVAPFKPQNMSNNAAACPSGGEIGRAQALQARACGLDPHTDMNPVLLKPQTDCASQVVVQGRATGAVEAADYMANRDRLMGAVMESFERLTARHDLVVVEGAGSPAEVNLRARDIANMGFARRAGVPVCLIGDIEKGGVIASLVGTKAVMDPHDAAMISGFLVNKFRGDPSLFDDGVTAIEHATGWTHFGTIPWLSATARLPAEDAVILNRPATKRENALTIAAPMLSRIANFDDADPLKLELGVAFQWVPPGHAIPRFADIIILFGTKSTLGDLAFLRAQGWDHDIIAHARAGGRVFGICGGYQMLGRQVHDPDGVDGQAGSARGLGLLDVDTRMRGEKRVAPITGTSVRLGETITGYEIHMGETTGPDTVRPFAHINGSPDGATSPSGLIQGTYIHGAFTSDGFRQAWLAEAGVAADPTLAYGASVDSALDALADGVEAAIDSDALLEQAAEPGWNPITR
ncbi:MAG: cobyric acid synthase [Pseudomonadota bacterium]